MASRCLVLPSQRDRSFFFLHSARVAAWACGVTHKSLPLSFYSASQTHYIWANSQTHTSKVTFCLASIISSVFYRQVQLKSSEDLLLLAVTSKKYHHFCSALNFKYWLYASTYSPYNSGTLVKNNAIYTEYISVCVCVYTYMCILCLCILNTE